MAMQYCANCGEPVTAGERFCGNCGRDVTAPGSVTNIPSLHKGNPSPVQPKTGNSLPLLVTVVVVILILVVGGYLLFANKGNNSTNNQAGIISSPTPGNAVVGNPSATPVSAVSNPTDTPDGAVSNPTDTPASAVGNATNTPNQELSAAIATMNSLTGFSASFTGEISNTSLMLVGDFSKGSASYAGRVNDQVFDAIYANNTGYISTDRGKTWQNDSQNLTRYVSKVYDILNSISIGNGDTVTYEGTTTLQDGTPAKQLRASESLDTIQITMQTVDLQGRRAVAHLQYDDSGNRIQATIDYSKFNETVNVAAPSVTK